MNFARIRKAVGQWRKRGLEGMGVRINERWRVERGGSSVRPLRTWPGIHC